MKVMGKFPWGKGECINFGKKGGAGNFEGKWGMIGGVNTVEKGQKLGRIGMVIVSRACVSVDG